METILISSERVEKFQNCEIESKILVVIGQELKVFRKSKSKYAFIYLQRTKKSVFFVADCDSKTSAPFLQNSSVLFACFIHYWCLFRCFTY